MSNSFQITTEDLQSLHFDQMLTLLDKQCMGPLGKAHVRFIKPLTDLEKIDALLKETNSYKKSFEEQEPIPLFNYDALKEELDQLKIAGYVLTIESIQKLAKLFEIVLHLKKYFVKGKQAKYNILFNYVESLYETDDWVKSIHKILDEDGEVRPNASPELVKISRSIISTQVEVDKSFKKIMTSFRDKGFLSDSAESVRNGRRVLSVTADNKRQVGGIIHDESASGRTAFVEPAEVVLLNNEIVELHLAKRKEIYKLLKSLSEMLHPYQEEIRSMYHTIGKLDLIRAKAKLAISYEGTMPKVVDEVALGIEQGKHPLLFIKNKADRKKTIPFDLTLHKPNRIVLVSGPNAGGKSILMKAVGLIQLMVQSGMLVPVEETSTIGIFHKLFADIGDQQSIENELSTYSGRLEKMKYILLRADKRTMLLIDEFGSGTDPKLGAAMAESLLRALDKKNVAGVITTHYSNLKAFAFQTKGFVNGAMVFDKEKMIPTYQLKIGRPGSSFTFEIAENTGLSKDIVKYARKRSGKAHQAMEDLLLDLEEKRSKLESSLLQAVRKEKNLDQLIKNYDRMAKELDVQRKKFKLKKKEEEFQTVSQYQKKMEKLVRELKANQSKEAAVKAKESLEEIKTEQKELRENVVELQEIVTEQIRADIDPSKLVPGAFARLQDGNTIGQIQSIDRKDAFVVFGGLTMRVKLKKLIPANAPIEKQSSKTIISEVQKNEKFEPKLDIRGLRPSEADKAVQKFMDEALLSNVLRLQIVHGKGSGVLRKLVHKKLREYRVTNYSHPEDNMGGDGVTSIEI